MQLLPGWHPLVVHFPLALVMVAVACLSAVRFMPRSRHRASLAIVGTWNLCLGAAAAFLALGSGLAAAVDLNLAPAARAALSLHVKSAVLTALLLLLAALWRGVGARQTSTPSWPFLIVLWAAGAALTLTGYRGGQNVYRYGIGVAPGAVAQPSRGGID